jgi:hypothetical protein
MRDAEQTGSDGKGKDGLMGYLARSGKDRPAAPQWPNAVDFDTGVVVARPIHRRTRARPRSL